MKFKCLLINPWIYDFAAYNFWAKPLGLLKVAEFLSQFNVELFLIDCCNSFKIKKYGTGKYRAEVVEKPEILKKIPRKYKKYGISTEEFIANLKNLGSVDFIFVTSIMAYWWYGVKEVIEILRNYFINTPIILGGIYATLYKEHAEKQINADFIYKGHINIRIIHELERIGLKLERITDKPKYWWQMGFYRELPYAPILTSTGCPFKCPYCASSILYESFEQRLLNEIMEEIEALHLTGVRDFAFYDDALLYKSDIHIKPLLKKIIAKNLDLRFHTPNGVHARFIDKELAQLMKYSGFKTLRLSLETVDIKRQLETGGKVTNDELEKAVYSLKEAGFASQDIGVYIMYGLPGQSFDELRAGVDFLKNLKVRIHLNEFSPIKGTYYWQEFVTKNIITDELDPLLTNNSIFSEIFAGYNREDIKKLKIEVNNFNLIL
ncbi:MAG TPA: B12-binding domain-containing radical SAM protein [Thermodesulfovibrio thiophilus]|uniref:B12-binding domain-containing radical SAM protein n=1 Tax=Thermodesulfovibrio thiophilus TaxID=340095 RepID=UPI001818C6B8|nr:B12-binding domain-containing radical SAM protein [Thermodesulfovibrio thiophilus]HHW20305.1 radical SAM protein [Thermodesulfovibrio thiophilus]HOA82634.1 B12-binding domain-containing radical SAM protein [Thermodesulfovibrio thiophilus]HQA03351.1 B12-binding domain-containing radical SAM protein [Thermodesulfovibrio thiophilus]HQD35761.1 B12-binding domain-containing radical SAM protein [Thermodesulfovibrio thiophilus]